jgi:hypothetical protein
MRGMSRGRLNSLVACFATLALLLCQAAGLVHARTVEQLEIQANAPACHSVSREHGNPGKALHIPCDSAQSVGETFKLPAVTPALLGFILAFTAAWTPVTTTPPVLHLVHAGAPPPPRLLHCRLLN